MAVFDLQKHAFVGDVGTLLVPETDDLTRRLAMLVEGECELGPKRNYRRTDEIVRQVIRHRFLDPEASADVITQKLVQTGASARRRKLLRRRRLRRRIFLGIGPVSHGIQENGPW